MLSAADREIRLGTWKSVCAVPVAFAPDREITVTTDRNNLSRGGTRSAAPLAPGLIGTSGSRAVILIRIAVGLVFTSEGIQKFLHADAIGAGRFARIGIPAPELIAPFVGVAEITCGCLILAGLLTRIAAVPLIIIMLVAIASTRIPILVGHGYFLFADPTVSRTGLWSMLHESRTDLSMLLASTFLLLVGAGRWSLDARLANRRTGSGAGDRP